MRTRFNKEERKKSVNVCLSPFLFEGEGKGLGKEEGEAVIQTDRFRKGLVVVGSILASIKGLLHVYLCTIGIEGGGGGGIAFSGRQKKQRQTCSI